MKKTRMWMLSPQSNGQPTVTVVDSVEQTETERLLEDALTGHPELLMPNLHLIGRQTETAGGPLDLLGVDEEGQLVVFELKRGTLTREAVAQAIDYASALVELGAEELCRHINSNAGSGGYEAIDHFESWYTDTYHKAVSDIGVPRIVLVGLGVDERATRMVEFLARCDLDISLITFHAFKQGDQTLLSRQIEVQANTGATSVKNSKQNNQARLDARLAASALSATYDRFVTAIQDGLDDSAYRWTNASGYSWYLPETAASGGPSNRAYVALYLSERNPEQIQLMLQPRAVEAAGEMNINEFAARVHGQFLPWGGGSEIWLAASAEAASTTADALTQLSRAITSGWKVKLLDSRESFDETDVVT